MDRNPAFTLNKPRSRLGRWFDAAASILISAAVIAATALIGLRAADDGVVLDDATPLVRLVGELWWLLGLFGVAGVVAGIYSFRLKDLPRAFASALALLLAVGAYVIVLLAVQYFAEVGWPT
ncbi:hypothetical protein [Arhodomonas sp. AD133]|uniref:hypothetical protein n=1 Tax=Arhodomonas sp. AD133 TaxID=3415009 RepID=UPI003EBC0F43